MVINRDDLSASFLSGLLGGIVLGLLLHFTSDFILALGNLLGQPSLIKGWAILLLTSVVFGAGYAILQNKLVDRFISIVLGLTSRSSAIKDLVMPLTDRFGLALVVTTAMGIVYGLAIGLGFGGIIVPALPSTFDLQYLNPMVILGYLLFGAVLGIIYGKLVVE